LKIVFKTKKIPIYEVKENDLIASFNIETKKKEFKKVLETFKPVVETKDQIKISFSDGESYTTSDWHPTLVFEDEKFIYKKAEELKIGDITINSKDEMVSISGINNNPEADINYIDITVEDNNNYFCSTEGEIFHVVHNTRPGAITLALDWWHLDINSFLDIKSELTGDLRDKAFDIFPQVVVDKWFVEKKENNEDVYLVNQYEVQKKYNVDMTELQGEELYNLHKMLETEINNGKFNHYKKINSKKLWKKIMWTWVEIGDFYIVNKDGLNKSNYLAYDPEGGIAKNANLCLIGSTLIDIKFEGKEKRIRLDSMNDYINKGIVYIKSKNIDTKEIQWKECYEFLDMGETNELFEVQDNFGNVITCTGDHKIYTENRGYVETKNLTSQDILDSSYVKDALHKKNVISKHQKIHKIKLEKKEKIYDINVKDNHNFYANNILVHNCVESFSFSKAPTEWSEKSNLDARTTIETNGKYHACNLASIVATNLVTKNDEFIKDVCKFAVIILDASIDEGKMPVLEAKEMSEAIRNIGIGLVGMGDMMAYNNKMYDTEDGQKFGEKFIEKISYFSYLASSELAEELGSYPLFKPENYDKILGYDPRELNKMSLNNFDWVKLRERILSKGIRNFYLLAFAPNSSTGILMCAIASYLPVYNKEMYQTLADMSLPIIPKYIDKHYWSYKTKFQYIECTRKWQKWVDTGMSMEININPEICKINEISNAILEGFSKNELKSVYYSLTIDGKKGDACSDCGN